MSKSRWFEYQDETGELRHWVERIEYEDKPKVCIPWRPDGKGGRVKGLDGIERIPYRLPETIEAVQRGATVFLCEGEKNTEDVISLGLAATTNSGGALSWKDGFSDYLKGADVVILEDNDQAGRDRTEKVTRSLWGKAKTIKVLRFTDLPEKGDISDWRDAGGTKEELLKMVAEAPAWEPKEQQPKELFRPITVRLSDVEPEEVSWLWDPYIPIGKLTILEGDPGIGKTFAALAITAAVTNSTGLPGQDGRPGPGRDPRNVIYLTGEDGLADTLRPRLDAIGADADRVIALQGYSTHDQDTGETTEHQVSMRDLNVLDRVLSEHEPALLVIDPLQAFLGADTDMHRSNETRPVLMGVARLAEKHACAVLLIRHLSKSQADRAIYRGLGSIDFVAAARSVLLAGQDPQDPTKRAIIHTKGSLSEQGVSIAYELKDRQFLWTGVSDLTAGQVMQPDKYAETDSKLKIDEAKDFLRDYLADGPQPTNEVLKKAENAGMNIVTIRRAKSDLGIDSYKEPGRTGRWFYKLQLEDDHSDHNPETSIYSPNDHLLTSPETLAGQGIREDDQHNNMITFSEPLQDKGLKARLEDDQESILGETIEDQDNDPVNFEEVRI